MGLIVNSHTANSLRREGSIKYFAFLTDCISWNYVITCSRADEVTPDRKAWGNRPGLFNPFWILNPVVGFLFCFFYLRVTLLPPLKQSVASCHENISLHHAGFHPLVVTSLDSIKMDARRQSVFSQMWCAAHSESVQMKNTLFSDICNILHHTQMWRKASPSSCWQLTLQKLVSKKKSFSGSWHGRIEQGFFWLVLFRLCQNRWFML